MMEFTVNRLRRSSQRVARPRRERKFQSGGGYVVAKQTGAAHMFKYSDKWKIMKNFNDKFFVRLRKFYLSLIQRIVTIEITLLLKKIVSRACGYIVNVVR